MKSESGFSLAMASQPFHIKRNQVQSSAHTSTIIIVIIVTICRVSQKIVKGTIVVHKFRPFGRPWGILNIFFYFGHVAPLSNYWPLWAFWAYSISTLYIIYFVIKWHYRYLVCPCCWWLRSAQLSSRSASPSTFVYKRYLVCPCSWWPRSASSTSPPTQFGLSASSSASWQVLLQCHLSHNSSSKNGCVWVVIFLFTRMSFMNEWTLTFKIRSLTTKYSLSVNHKHCFEHGHCKCSRPNLGRSGGHYVHQPHLLDSSCWSVAGSVSL